MSDLQCPATVLVVRHGQSEGNLSRRLSSAAPGSALSELGHEQARAVGAQLLDRRVARVYSSPLQRAQQTAQEIADVVDVDVEILPGVHELGLGTFEGSDSTAGWAELDAVFVRWLDGDLTIGVGGDESGHDVVARFEDALDGVADLHRGETVVVVSHGGAMAVALPRMAGAGAHVVRGRPVPNAGVVELTRDADGWQLVHWPEPPRLGAPEVVDRIGRSDAEQGRVAGGVWSDVAGAVCSHLPIAQSWATRASFTALSDPPSPDQVEDVARWCEETSPGLWRVAVRGEHVDAVLAGALGRLRVEQTFEVRATATLPAPHPVEGLEVGPALDAAEFLGVYGAELAPLVVDRLERPDLTFLVGRVGGAAVACARVWDLAGVSYVSAVTVTPSARRRGIGRAISAAATAHGLRRHPLAWLHCEGELSGLYAALGYELVGTHVHLVQA